MWTVGVDLGSEIVKLVCLAQRRKEFELVSYGLFKRTEQDLIRETLQHTDFKKASVRVAMKDSMVKIRKLELPPAPEEDLEQMVKMAMTPLLPGPIANYILRYQPEQKIVLISDKKQVDEYLLELQKFGITSPAVLEPRVSALAHAAAHNHSLGLTEQYAIVDIGKSYALFSVISAGSLMFSRNLSEASGSDLLNQIAAQLQISPEEAEARKQQDPSFLTLDNSDTKSIIIQWLYKVAIEIQNSIESYQIQSPGIKIEELLLTGGISKLKGLSPYIQDTLKIKTGYLRTFQQINTSGFPQVNFEEIEQNYATAVGLAL